MRAFDFFDRVYCIHLPNAKRRELIEKQFERLGVKAEFIHAAAPPPQFSMTNMRRAPAGEFGVSLSQVKAVIHGISDGAQRPLFVEDDVTFSTQAEAQLLQAVAELPDDWDVLYLGGHPREKVARASSSLVRVGTFSCAEAYSLSRKALVGFLDRWCDRIARPDAMYDFILGEYAAKQQAYCVYPLICEQAPGMSQISGEFDDKRKLIARGWVANLGREQATAAHRAQSTA